MFKSSLKSVSVSGIMESMSLNIKTHLWFKRNHKSIWYPKKIIWILQSAITEHSCSKMFRISSVLSLASNNCSWYYHFLWTKWNNFYRFQTHALQGHGIIMTFMYQTAILTSVNITKEFNILEFSSITFHLPSIF